MNYIDARQNTILDRCCNFQDCENWNTSDGKITGANKLFRRNELHNLRTRDMSQLTTVLDVKAIMDLKNTSEIRRFKMENLPNHAINSVKTSLVVG
jgi:hypothetical protein